MIKTSGITAHKQPAHKTNNVKTVLSKNNEIIPKIATTSSMIPLIIKMILNEGNFSG